MEIVNAHKEKKHVETHAVKQDKHASADNVNLIPLLIAQLKTILIVTLPNKVYKELVFISLEIF
jgi:hypothetical protein